nr:MAG TPA: hypothetical protein [Caudoviricetes sp.]DAV61722.1 MAG TPA: hypothetical protein [Caudoviricetes sp.]
MIGASDRSRTCTPKALDPKFYFRLVEPLSEPFDSLHIKKQMI